MRIVRKNSYLGGKYLPSWKYAGAMTCISESKLSVIYIYFPKWTVAQQLKSTYLNSRYRKVCKFDKFTSKLRDRIHKVTYSAREMNRNSL